MDGNQRDFTEICPYAITRLRRDSYGNNDGCQVVVVRFVVSACFFHGMVVCMVVFRLLFVGVAMVLATAVGHAESDTCKACRFPCKRSESETFTLRMRGGMLDPVHAFTSVTRDTMHIGSTIVQSLRLHWRDADSCRDTSIVCGDVSNIVLGRTLGKVPPLYVPIHPVPEYQITRVPDRPTSFFEIGPWAGYAGADSSAQPRIGFEQFMYGAEALIAPFGSLLGEKLSLAIGGGALLEAGRVRVPVSAQLRYTFATPSLQEAVTYVPNPCTFDCGQQGTALQLPQDPDMVRLPGPERVDSTAALLRTTEVVIPARAPYLFLEGAYVFNGNFEGRGPEPSVNPDDYGQYLFGLGVGIPVVWRLHAQLAYRYARLNLRTPCEECTDLFLVNTNSIHAVMLRFMLHWGW